MCLCAAVPVSPAAPREEEGLYWGYTTRVAPTLKDAIEQCPFQVRQPQVFEEKSVEAPFKREQTKHNGTPAPPKAR